MPTLTDIAWSSGRLPELHWNVLAREGLRHHPQGQDGRREGVHRVRDDLKVQQLADPGAGRRGLQHGYEESRHDGTWSPQHRPLQVGQAWCYLIPDFDVRRLRLLILFLDRCQEKM